MTSPNLRVARPLRYVIACAGCKAEIEICPEELDSRIAVCGKCNLPNPTPVFALLSGRRRTTPPGDGLSDPGKLKD